MPVTNSPRLHTRARARSDIRAMTDSRRPSKLLVVDQPITRSIFRSTTSVRRAAAELLVVDQRHRGAIDAVAARRALRIAAQLELAKARLQCVVDEQAPGERVAEAEHELDRLGRLEHA